MTQALQLASTPDNYDPTAPSPKTKKSKTKPRKAKPIETKTPMLEPLNKLDVAEPGTSGETLNQRRLREFYELQNAYLELRDRYNARYAQVKDLLMHGAAVQTGTFKVRAGVRLRRHPRYKQALIDIKGEDYQKRVLEGTQPHAYFIVRID